MAKGEVREHVKSLLMVMASDVTIVFIESQFFGSDILANTFLDIHRGVFHLTRARHCRMARTEKYVQHAEIDFTQRVHTPADIMGKIRKMTFSITAVPWFLCSVV